MNHKQTLKQWIKTNEKYFQTHPDALKTMLADPTFLSRFNHKMSSKKSRLERRLSRIERKNVKPSTNSKKKARFGFPFRFPSISAMSQKLNHANEIIDTIRSLSDSIR